MAWGVKTGAADLVQKLQAGNTKSMYVLRTRTVNAADAIALAAALESHPMMEEFYLSGHELDHTGLAAFANVLATNKVLQKLAVGTSSLGDAGVALLANGLEKNGSSALIEWDMEFKGFGNQGAASIGTMLASNNSLVHVNVSRNQFDGAGLDSIVAGLHASTSKCVKSLDLHDSNLTFSGSSVVSDYLADPSCSLEKLLLTGNPLGSSVVSAFEALGRNKSVKSLYLSQCSLSESALVALGHALATNTSIEHLDVSQNTLTEASVAAFVAGLAQNRSLKHLDFSQTSLNDAFVSQLASELPEQLVALNISGNGLTHVSIAPLVSKTKVLELRLFNNSLQNGVDILLSAVQANSTIQVLDIGANSLHGSLAASVFDGLHTHPSLKTLEMGGNNLGDVGLAALERLQAANPGLDVAMDKNAGNDNE